MYSLHTAGLCKADLRKIDAFQARCLRSILDIPHSFISHVRNETVLQEAGTEKLSIILWRRQLLLLGRIAQLPREDVMRTCIFHDGTFQPRWHDGLRKRGKPKQTWPSEVFFFPTDLFHEEILHAVPVHKLRRPKSPRSPGRFSRTGAGGWGEREEGPRAQPREGHSSPRGPHQRWQCARGGGRGDSLREHGRLRRKARQTSG